MKHVLRVLNPLDPTAGYAVPHALVILVALIIAFSAGVFTGSRYTASYYRTHYAAPLHEPAGMAPAPAFAPRSVAAVSELDMRFVPGVMDQGPAGSCCGHNTMLALDYAYRVAHPTTHPGIRFSPSCAYSAYALQYNHGQDVGSWPVQIGQIVASQGVPQYRWCPEPPYGVSAWTAAQQQNAAKWRIPNVVTTLAQGSGGQGIVDAIRVAVGTNHVALVALNVTPSFDAATDNGGRVWDRGPEGNRGAHCVGFIATDDSMAMPDGTIGAAEVQNSWGTGWGKGGRAWVSYAWLARNAWAVQDLDLQ